MTTVITTIAKGAHNQLLVTVPKKIADYEQFGKGTKVKWHRRKGRVYAEVLI
jgi:hypothetical protein